ncbi:hypothetical protein Tco_0014463, partial [Tanacetum coccineum]
VGSFKMFAIWRCILMLNKGDASGKFYVVLKARHILCEKQIKINEAYKKLQDGWLSKGDKVPLAEFSKIFHMVNEMFLSQIEFRGCYVDLEVLDRSPCPYTHGGVVVTISLNYEDDNGNRGRDSETHNVRLSIFNHVDTDCPKGAKVADNTVEKDDDGFTKVTRKNGKGKQDGKPMTNGNKGQALHMMRLRMYSLALWNIKGMNQATKQKEVCHVIYDNNLCLCTTLESHVANSNLQVFKDHIEFHENVKRLRHELDEAQKALDLDPSNFEFREEKAAYLQVFNDASLMEEWSLSQKAKIEAHPRWERGLRQGNPMSPIYLLILDGGSYSYVHQRPRGESNSFTYHRYCSKLNIINLCFADDLFLFAHGDVNSARVIMDSLEEFKNASGLTFSLPKSTAYFCNVLNHVKLDILNILPFEEGKLHVKYLDVPLVLSRLVHRNCSKLIKKVKRRISDWKNKSLSLSEMRKGRAKVAWEDVCLPKDEGGLGIRRLETFNKALISSHIWSLLSHRESLWVKWIHDYKLKGRTFWEMPNHGRRSWGWRPLADFVTYRDIYNVGFPLNAKVRDIIDNGSWGWPHGWILKYPLLVNTVVPQLADTADKLIWKDHHNMDIGFIIPRHAVHLWLVIKRKLKTQDTLRQWDVWEYLKRFTGMSNIPSDLNFIVDFLIPLAKMQSVKSVIAKLVFDASSPLMQIQEDDECSNVDSSLEVAYLSYRSFKELMLMLLDSECSLVCAFEAVFKMECSPVVVLFFLL